MNLIEQRDSAHRAFEALRQKECPKVHFAPFPPAVQELWLKYANLGKACWLESRRLNNGSEI